MNEINDVDLDKFLSESEEHSPSGASTEKENADGKGSKSSDQNASEGVKTPGMSERENSRVRDLVDEVSALKEFITQKLNHSQPAESSRDASDLDKFLESTVSDKPSRELLKKYAGVLRDEMKAEFRKEFNPRFSEVEDMRFEREFSQYASRFPNLQAHKQELLKTFKANPNASVKALVGELILEQSASRVKPVETQRSQARRDRIDTDSMSKDELYELLEENLKN
jgi:hypothetical protein